MTVKGNERPARKHVRARRERELRIIAGAWRGRRFRFPDVAGIRPTPDRVRETLFNWLVADIVDARCVDIFSGSGALGLEALSRGASAVTFIESDARAAASLRLTLGELGAPDAATVVEADALRWLRGSAEPFDIVFLDPPFDAGLVLPTARLLEEYGWLAPDTLIYLECGARDSLADLPRSWTRIRTGRAGEVGYHLYRREIQEPPANEA